MTSHEVVGRDVGGHPHRDALAAVDQQVREAGRQDERLLVLAVVVRHHVDGVFVDAGQHAHGQRREPCLGVALGGGRELGRAVVAVEVDQRVAQRERLRHAGQRVVDRRRAVGVVVGHDVAGGAGALDVVAVGPEALHVHRPQDPAVHGLQAVAGVGQRPRHDDRHRVVQEGALHLLLDLDDLDAVARSSRAGAGLVGRLGRGDVTHGGFDRSELARSPVRGPDPQKSRFRTSRALVTMKALRSSTSSPMRIEVISSAMIACSRLTWTACAGRGPSSCRAAPPSPSRRGP